MCLADLKGSSMKESRWEVQQCLQCVFDNFQEDHWIEFLSFATFRGTPVMQLGQQ